MHERGVIGWDIGGVNTKVARVRADQVLVARSHPYEIQRDPLALTSLLRSLANAVGATADDRHAVTMTAELSQMFRAKREGVAFVLDAVMKAFPSSEVRVFTADGRFLSPTDALNEPLAVAASNWAATANIVALDHPDAILIDIGTTTTDIIPIVRGRVAALGTTDPSRLASAELVYTGVLRTPVEAIAQHVPFESSFARTSAESFALSGDAHVWRGDLAPEDYSVAAPDGRPASREFAGERIARVVCADREMLDDGAISMIADAVADAQVKLISRAIARVRQRHPALQAAVVTGLGSFLATRAAQRVGLSVVQLADSIGTDGSRCAPAAAVALRLSGHSEPAGEESRSSRQSESSSRAQRGIAILTAEGHPSFSTTAIPRLSARNDTVDTVFKIGGSLLAYPDLLVSTLAAIVEESTRARVAIVPGGGPFADAVRDAGRRLHLRDDTAHWMAILAMDQYAHLVGGMREELVLAATARDVHAIVTSGRIPIIAPYHWLRDADPLPHSWDVTSDSISAWFASELGATQLVLVKPPGATGENAVDPHFPHVLSPSLRWSIAVAPLLPRALEHVPR
jgi:probable H4MPT-linked C1 transfer pathway protein